MAIRGCLSSGALILTDAKTESDAQEIYWGEKPVKNKESEERTFRPPWKSDPCRRREGREDYYDGAEGASDYSASLKESLGQADRELGIKAARQSSFVLGRHSQSPVPHHA